jgi:hypothetical protein
MLYDAGITPPTQGGWALQAKNWASSTYSIPNWEHKGTGVPWEPGDVIAEKRDYIDATGHCGIAISSSEVMAAGTNKVSKDNHKLEGGSVRRYTGK